MYTDAMRPTPPAARLPSPRNAVRRRPAVAPLRGRDAALTALYGRLLRRQPPARRGAVIGAGLAVRPSSLGPRAGWGLFATRRFAAGAVVTAMEGAVFAGRGAPRASVAAGRPWSHFRTLLRGALWLDGLAVRPAPRGAGGASYANDAAGAAGAGVRANNATFVVFHDRANATLPLVALRARRDIHPGEEILVAYGRDHWRRYASERRGGG
jgi:hypothetical protein